MDSDTRGFSIKRKNGTQPASKQAAIQPLPEEVHVDSMAKRLARFMKQYQGVDGTDQVTLRDWLERASSQTDGTVIQALRSYESVNPTVEGLLFHIRQLRVAPQETDRSISEVEQLCQGPNLNVLEYVAQFRVHVNREYPRGSAKWENFP